MVQAASRVDTERPNTFSSGDLLRKCRTPVDLDENAKFHSDSTSWLETSECCYIPFALIDDRFTTIVGCRLRLRLGTKNKPAEDFSFTIRRAVVKACSGWPHRRG